MTLKKNLVMRKYMEAVRTYSSNWTGDENTIVARSYAGDPSNEYKPGHESRLIPVAEACNANCRFSNWPSPPILQQIKSVPVSSLIIQTRNARTTASFQSANHT